MWSARLSAPTPSRWYTRPTPPTPRNGALRLPRPRPTTTNNIQDSNEPTDAPATTNIPVLHGHGLLTGFPRALSVAGEVERLAHDMLMMVRWDGRLDGRVCEAAGAEE